MSGVATIRYLLANAAPVTTIVPAERIVVGDLPLKTQLPAISIRQVDSLPESAIRTNEAKKMHTDRVQVSYLFSGDSGGYPATVSMGKLVLAACPGQRGTVNGVVVDSIVPDLEGPDLYSQDINIYSRSRDFIVKWIGA